mmetsp:Transcript_5431/g.14665  ORF Transcript_5431/g.14665 Transcript_5431/m.14665 type:complete len:136 (-) Transcript_5431:790-1197(-)
MAHLLWKFGEAALKPSQNGNKLLPPLVSFSQAMKLRSQFYKEGQPWPYEHIVPGAPQPPSGAEAYLKRQEAKELRRQQRVKEIQDAMAKMPQMIARHKELLRLDWNEVSQVDKLTMTRTAIKKSYIRKRLIKLAS